MKQSKATVRVLVYSPDRQRGEVREVENSLESFQAMVGGSIEGYSMGGEIMMICNGNGIAEGLPHNPNSERLPHSVPGVFFFARADEDGNETDLTDADIALLRTDVESEPEPVTETRRELPPFTVKLWRLTGTEFVYSREYERRTYRTKPNSPICKHRVLKITDAKLTISPPPGGEKPIQINAYELQTGGAAHHVATRRHYWLTEEEARIGNTGFE